MKTLQTYPKPSVTIDSIVFGYHGENLSVLLIRRKEPPFDGAWTLPGGFLYLQESLANCASRILQQKTGLQGVYLEQLYTFDAIDRDPRDRVLSVAYFALVNPTRFELVAGTATEGTAWFPVDALPELGFDHKSIIDCGLQRLRAKVRYQPIGFELLDSQFTFQELHKLYETILQKTINRGNFWKKIRETSLLKPTGMKRTGVKFRSPELFEFDKTKYLELTESGFEFSI